MKTLLFIFPLLLSSWSIAQTDYAKFRPLQLNGDSKFIVHFDNPGLFTDGGLVWTEESATEWKECNLKIHSYYDEALAKQLKKAVYYLTQSHGQTSLWSTSPGIFQQQDQFIYWLSTKNKELPYLSFECHWRVNHDAPQKFFTLEKVAAFTGLSHFFWQPMIQEDTPRLAISQIVKNQLQVETLIDLAFSAKQAGSGFSLETPHFTDGKASVPGGRYACSISYRKGSELGEYSIVLPKGQKGILKEAWEVGNLLNLGFQSGEINLNLLCIHNGKHPMGFVRHHLQGVVRLSDL